MMQQMRNMFSTMSKDDGSFDCGTMMQKCKAQADENPKNRKT
jgi:hypothetical protein